MGAHAAGGANGGGDESRIRQENEMMREVGFGVSKTENDTANYPYSAVQLVRDPLLVMNPSDVFTNPFTSYIELNMIHPFSSFE